MMATTMGSEESGGKYWAFISYSSKDRKWGQWLHRRLENYSIPEQFRGTEMSDGTVLGKNLRPVFRDRDELAGSSDLGPSILRALRKTRYLIVLCSKNSAKSVWVNKEIEDFKALGGEKRILALILDGEPNASTMPGMDALEECFPSALRLPAEPLAGDLRREGDGVERGFLKILAGVAQLDFDALYRRHERSQRRRRVTFASVALAVMVSLAGLATFALMQKREAEKQRSAAETNELIAKENGEIAKTQRNIAIRQNEEAKITLSNKLLEQGLSSLTKGMVEEGLAALTSSLETWPGNPYSRDRLLFELTHRSWLLPETSSKLPFDFLLDTLPPAGDDVDLTSEIAFGPMKGSGGVSLVESVNFFDNNTNETEIRRRKSVWDSGEWTTGKIEIENGDDQPQFEYTTDLGNGLKLISEPMEMPQGCWDVIVQNALGETVPFRNLSYDGVTYNTALPRGVPALSADRNSIAVVGLQKASEDGTESENGYFPESQIHVTTYDSKSLIQRGINDFTFPIAEDADVVRAWWSGKHLGIHTRQDNRRMDRFDWIDFSGDEPRFLAKNVAIKSDLWYFDNGKIFLLGKFRTPQGKVEWRMEVSKVLLPPSYGQGLETLKVKRSDFVWFSDQKVKASTIPRTDMGGVWESFGAESLYMASLDSLNQPSVAAKWESGGAIKTAEKNGAGVIAISFSDGRPSFHIPVKLKSGEGGRDIQGLGFSPKGDYIVVNGAVGVGNQGDWEILGTDVGMQLFPVVYPREQKDAIQLVPFCEQAHIDGLHALGWSKDGRFLALSYARDLPEEDAPEELDQLLPDPDGEAVREAYLFPILFCNDPVPDWFFEAVHEFIGIRQSGNGQFDVLPATSGKLLQFAEDHSDDPYGKWLKDRLSSQSE